MAIFKVIPNIRPDAEVKTASVRILTNSINGSISFLIETYAIPHIIDNFTRAIAVLTSAFFEIRFFAPVNGFIFLKSGISAFLLKTIPTCEYEAIAPTIINPPIIGRTPFRFLNDISINKPIKVSTLKFS